MESDELGVRLKRATRRQIAVIRNSRVREEYLSTRSHSVASVKRVAADTAIGRSSRFSAGGWECIVSGQADGG